MEKVMKMWRIWKIGLILLVVLSWISVPFVLQKKVGASSDIPIVVRTANLVSPTGSINPHGTAKWELYANGHREIEVEIEDVNLPSGTSLNVVVDNNPLVLQPDQRGKLKLRTQNGQQVPTVNNGSTVEVLNDNTVLVAGVFGGGPPNPTPTSSPTPSPTESPTPSPSPGNAGDLFAVLSGGTFNGVLPGGFAKYEIHSSRRELEVRVIRVNLPIGTALNVQVGGTNVGQIVLESGGEGRLKLRTDRGHNVPNVTVGMNIVVKNAETTILSGTFTSNSPTPGNTPGPSPTPNQSRYFEVHPTGGQLNPPVNTNARGEFKVFLNATETQATLTGEFHGLSSAQTGARIEALIGTATMIHDFGAIGGTNGRFANVTINVTQAQVQQLRAGLWFVTVSSVNHPGGEIGGTFRQHSNTADFDGDGSNDLAVFRPSTGIWYANNGNGFSAISFGSSADVPVSADYDGDGKTDRAVFRNVNGLAVWEIQRSSDGGVTATQFGFASDIPVRGDFDGDGRNDLAVFRSSSGVWYVQKSDNSGFIIIQFGMNGDIPVAPDLDGDGKSDLAVFRPSTGVWYWIRSSNNSFGAVQFGSNGDKPVKGDFDGDGSDDIAVYRPSTGVWYIWKSRDGSFDIRQFGLAEDIPVAGNYDGDTKTDIAVFRPSNGIWYIWRSSDDTFEFRQFGLSGDIPTNR